MANKNKPEQIIIDTGEKKIDIVRNGKKVGIFVFHPADYAEAQRHANIIVELEQQQAEYGEKAAKLEETGSDSEKIDFFVEFLQGILHKIDVVYGDGTSAMLFGGVLDIDAILSFFQQLQPYYQEASEARKNRVLKK